MPEGAGTKRGFPRIEGFGCVLLHRAAQTEDDRCEGDGGGCCWKTVELFCSDRGEALLGSGKGEEERDVLSAEGGRVVAWASREARVPELPLYSKTPCHRC